jgi:hypothetical protein
VQVATVPRDAGVAHRDHHDARPIAVAAAPPADASAPAATTPAADPGFLVDGIPDQKHFDPIAQLPAMQALARRIYPDARLVNFGGLGLVASGAFDLVPNTNYVTYTFRSESAPRAPRGLHTYCLVTVQTHPGFIQVSTTWSYDCADPYLALRCNGAGLWKAAVAKGAPTDGVLYVERYHGGWRLWLGNDYTYEFSDADCAR